MPAPSERGAARGQEAPISAAATARLQQLDDVATPPPQQGLGGGGAAAAAAPAYVSPGSPTAGPGAAPGSPGAPLESPEAASQPPGSPKLQPADSARSVASVDGSEAGGSEASGSSGSSLSPHYDDKRDIVLRLEFLRTTEVKAIIRSVAATVAAGVGILIVALYMKIEKGDAHYLQQDTVPIINLCFASVLCAAVLACWAIFFVRVYRSNLSGKRWSHRRRRAATLAGAELTLQLVNLVFFILPNAYVLTHECAWFSPVVLWSGFVRWSCWNSLFLIFVVQAHSANSVKYASPHWRRRIDREDAAIMDAPLWLHWPKLGLWLALEGVLLALTLVVQTRSAPPVAWNPAIADCRLQPWDCSFSPAAITLLGLNVACLVSYWLLYLFFIARALNNLKYLSYSAMRMANLTTRLNIRLRSLSIFFFMLCVITYTFVELNTCSSYVISWLGYLPMQLVMSATAIASGYLSMPKRPHEAGILQVWLQEFAWTEADVPRKRQERASSLPPGPQATALEQEPIFCFETAVKCMFWAFLVYDYHEQRSSKPAAARAAAVTASAATARGEGGVAGAPADADAAPGAPLDPAAADKADAAEVDAALALWDLENFELFWEQELDTKAVVGWSDDTVVIAFRGTASLANVKSDLQFWRSRWPPHTGNPLLGTAPMVHRGFLRAYTHNAFNERLLTRLRLILRRCAEGGTCGPSRPVNVIVTGHSLGGALATLCAYDIRQHCPCSQQLVRVKCITFGAPRTGNHAHVRTYDACVPDTWHLINNDDVITKTGKFWTMYKRGGHRVLINRLGDMVVRPSFVETAIRGVPGGASVKDHLLTSYSKAVVAVVAAQFGRKSFSAGREGALSLAQQKGMQAVLQSAGLTHKEMRVLQEHGWDAWRAAQGSRRQRSRRARSGVPPEAAAAAAAEAGGATPAGSGFLRWACCGGLAAVAERQGQPLEAAAAAEPATTAEAAGAGRQLEAAEAGQQLEAVVVEPGGLPRAAADAAADGHLQAPRTGAADRPLQAAAAAAAPGAVQPAQAAEPAAGQDVEVGSAPVQTAEEQGGVLHACHMRCRARCGRRHQTICSLLGKRGAAVAPAPEPPAPMCDPPPHAAQTEQQQQQQLGAIAEEEGSSLPPSPLSSPTPGEQRSGGRSWWAPAAAALGWETAPRRLPSLSRTLSSASSLGSAASSPLSGGAGTRGPSRGEAIRLLVD